MKMRISGQYVLRMSQGSKAGPIIGVEEERADHDEDDGNGERRPLGWGVWGHRGPRRLLVRIL